MCKYALAVCACQHRIPVLVGHCPQAPLVGEGDLPPPRRLRRSVSLPCNLHRIVGSAPLQASAGEVAAMLPSLGLRAAGLRGSDESATLYNSDAIMQHIAESVRHRTREQSLSNLLDCQSELSDVEAELDSLKEEVQSMRADRDQREFNTLADEYLAKCPGAISTAQEDSSPPSPVHETPAQALMRRFAAQDAAAASRIPEPIKQPSPLKAKDFPTLGNPKTTTDTSSSEMRSYVGALTSKARGTAGNKAQRDNPGFLQPTQATTRRTGETLKKVSAVATPENSPTKSAKGKPPSLETEKRATMKQGSPRPSLPLTWTSQSPEKKELGSASATTTPSSANRIPKQTISTHRKQGASYMSSTKATYNRQNAPSSKVSSKQAMPRVKAAGLAIDTTNQGPKTAAAQSAPSATDFAITSGSSDGIFGSPSTRATAEASMKSSRAPSTVQATPTSTQQRAGVLPAPLPDVANTVLTRRSSRKEILTPVIGRLAKHNLLKGQPVPQAGETTPLRHKRHKKAASHSGEYWPNSSRFSEESAVYIPQQTHVAEPTSAQSSFIQPQQAYPAGVANAQADVYQQQPSRPIAKNMKRHRGKRPERYKQPIHEGIGGLKGLSSRQIGEAMALAQDATPTAAPLGGRAAYDPAIVYQGLMPAAGFVLPEVDPAILYSASVRRHPAADATAATSSLNAIAPEFKPSWMPSTPPPMEIVSFPAPRITGNIEDEGPTAVYGQDPPQVRRAVDDRFFQELLSGNATASQMSMPVGEASPATLQAFDQSAQQQQIHQTPVALLGATPPAVMAESFITQDESSGLRKTVSAPSVSPWNIRGQGSRPYQWLGGNGREITYRGYGPDAEVDPNSPVSFFNPSTKKRVLHKNPAVMAPDEDQENQSPMPPTAPKKMRERLMHKSFDRMPCGVTDLIVNPDNCFPWLIPEPGCCYGCKNKNGWSGPYGTDTPIHFY